MMKSQFLGLVRDKNIATEWVKDVCNYLFNNESDKEFQAEFNSILIGLKYRGKRI